jgi:hypothetical protein
VTAKPAATVSGGGVPDRLKLPKLIEMLRYAIHREAIYPSRPELFNGLKRSKGRRGC